MLPRSLPPRKRIVTMRNEKEQPLPIDFDKDLELRCDAGYKLYSSLRQIIQHHAVESAITSWEIIGTLEVIKSDIMAQLSENSNNEDIF